MGGSSNAGEPGRTVAAASRTTGLWGAGTESFTVREVGHAAHAHAARGGLRAFERGLFHQHLLFGPQPAHDGAAQRLRRPAADRAGVGAHLVRRSAVAPDARTRPRRYPVTAGK